MVLFFLDGSSLRSEAWDLRMLEGGGGAESGMWGSGWWGVDDKVACGVRCPKMS